MDVDQRSFDFNRLTAEQLRARRTMKWNYFDEDVLPLWVAEMDFPTAPAVRAGVDAAVARESFGYPSPDARTGLPEAAADWTARRYGWRVPAERVHIVPDVLHGVDVAITEFSPEGSAVILPTPAYMPFFDVLAHARRPRVEVPMATDNGRYVLDLDAIDAAFADGAGTLLLCHPYNPLGRAFTRQELEAVSRVVARHGARVVADEIHAPLVYGERHIPYAGVSPEAASHTVTLSSASKAWNLPGLKCAYAITSNDADEETWRRLPMLRTFGASPIGIAANVAAFTEGEPWLDALLGHLDGQRQLLRDLLAEHLPQVGFTLPEATFMAWLDLRPLRLPAEPAEFLLEHARVALNPGPPFGENARGFARLNFATTTTILEQAVRAMAKAVADH